MLTLFQVLFAGTIKHRRAVQLWDWPQPKLWLWGCPYTGREFSKSCFISVFPLLPWIKISLFFFFFWNLCVKINFLGRIFLWPFFPEAPKPKKFRHDSSTPSTTSPLSPNRTQLSIIYTARKLHGVHTPSAETQFCFCAGNTILHFH